MAWRILERPKVVRCSRTLVNRFYDMRGWDGDRDLKPHIVSHIANEVDHKRFRVAAFASVLCKEDGLEYRVNGKHTSHVLSQMNGTFPEDLDAFVERFEADTRQDVPPIYATYDNPLNNRSTIDICQGFAAANQELLSVPRRILGVCSAGMSFAIWGDDLYAHKREERAKLLLDAPEFVLFAREILKGARKNIQHVNRSPVAAAMFLTWQKSRKAAGEFWELVRDGSGPDHTSGDRKLFKHLLATAVGRGRGKDKTKQQEDHRAMFVRCIHGWNAWRKGETTALNYHEDKPIPSVK